MSTRLLSAKQGKRNASISRSMMCMATVVAILIVMSGCATVRKPVMMPAVPSVAEVKATTVSYPLLLLHGIGQKAHVWEGAAADSYGNVLGLHFGGVMTMSGGSVRTTGYASGPRDFFTVSFSNPTDSVAGWSKELERYIAEVRRITGADEVTLVAYSMGGIAARHYLTKHLRDHHVRRLITIGTPHLGSPYARVYTLKAGIVKRLADSPSPLTAPFLQAAKSAIESCESDIAFDAPAVRDLIPPDNAGNFLDGLGKAPHPGDVEYVSVIGNVDVISDAQKLRSSALQEIIRRVSEMYDSGVSALLSQGDGVVSASSQVLTNIPWFTHKQENVRLARTVSLKSVHTKHLQSSPEIQRVTLECKPELHSAEWYLVNGIPSLVVHYRDFLQASSTECSVSYTGMAGERTQRSTQGMLVTLPSGERVCRVVMPLDDLDFSSPCTVRFTLKNSYGYTFTSTKTWTPPQSAPQD